MLVCCQESWNFRLDLFSVWLLCFIIIVEVYHYFLFCFVESKTPCKKMSNTELNYLKSLFNKSKNHRKKRATQNKRKRKEYRSLTEKERKVFHDAVLSLKAKSVCYNLFIPFISEMYHILCSFSIIFNRTAELHFKTYIVCTKK